MTIHATLIEDGELKDEISGDDLAALNLKLSHRLINMNNDISFADIEAIEEDVVGDDELFSQLKEIAADHDVDVHRIESVSPPAEIYILHLDRGPDTEPDVMAYFERCNAAEEVARRLELAGGESLGDLVKDTEALDQMLGDLGGSARLFTTRPVPSFEGVYAS